MQLVEWKTAEFSLSITNVVTQGYLSVSLLQAVVVSAGAASLSSPFPCLSFYCPLFA